MSIWKGSTQTIEKPWGHEHRWQAPWGTHGKLICIDADMRTSLKYYTAKDEVLFCYKGKVHVEAPEENEFGNRATHGRGSWFELTPGELIFIQRENSYRIRAVEDSVLIEVTSGGLGFQDGVRLEDDFDRVTERRNN